MARLFGRQVSSSAFLPRLAAPFAPLLSRNPLSSSDNHFYLQENLGCTVRSVIGQYSRGNALFLCTNRLFGPPHKCRTRQSSTDKAPNHSNLTLLVYTKCINYTPTLPRWLARCTSIRKGSLGIKFLDSCSHNVPRKQVLSPRVLSDTNKQVPDM